MRCARCQSLEREIARLQALLDEAADKAAAIVERDVDWTQFVREPDLDWRGVDRNAIWSRLKSWECFDEPPNYSDGPLNAYLCGIAAGRVMAAQIRREFAEAAATDGNKPA